MRRLPRLLSLDSILWIQGNSILQDTNVQRYKGAMVQESLGFKPTRMQRSLRIHADGLTTGRVWSCGINTKGLIAGDEQQESVIQWVRAGVWSETDCDNSIYCNRIDHRGNPLYDGEQTHYTNLLHKYSDEFVCMDVCVSQFCKKALAIQQAVNI